MFMKYYTTGLNYYEGVKVPVVVRKSMFCDNKIDDSFRLIFIPKGSGMVETLSGFSPFVAPTLCCINEKEIINIQSSHKYELLEMVYRPEFLNPSYNYKSIRSNQHICIEGDPHEETWLKAFTMRSPSYNGVINISSVISLRIFNILSQINKELTDQRDWYWPCRTRSLLLELLLVIDRMYVEPLTNESIIISKNNNNINEIIMYLLNHYHEKIQLTTLSEIFSINRTSLNEHFKEVTGHTVMSYLINLRIHLAMAMLKDTALSISEIMYRVGYTNISHFNRSFKKITDNSPLEYRKMHTWLYK